MKDSAISSHTYEATMDRMAYAIGFFLGDGCLTSYPFKSSTNGRTYYKNDVVFGKPDIETLALVQSAIADVFGFSCRISEKKLQSGSTYYEMKAYRRDIFDFFAVNTVMRSEIPKYYFGASDVVQGEVLMGLFDSDGHIAEFTDSGRQRWQMGFSNTNRKLVEDAAFLLRKLGVQVGKVCDAVGKKGTTYVIHPNIRTFVDCGLEFRSKRRQERVHRYLAHVVGPETRDAAPLM